MAESQNVADVVRAKEELEKAAGLINLAFAENSAPQVESLLVGVRDHIHEANKRIDEYSYIETPEPEVAPAHEVDDSPPRRRWWQR